MTLDGQAQLLNDRLHAVFDANTTISSLIPLAGDASSRRYYRALLHSAGAPQSVILMELPAGSSLPLSSEELAVFAHQPSELPFLNVHRFLSTIGVRVPKLYGHWESDGILMLEDLGDTALWDRVQGLPQAEVLSWYEKAIDQLLLLQIRGTNARDEKCIAFQQRFDYRLYMWEFDHFLEYGWEKRPGTRVSKAATAELRKIFADIAQRLDRYSSCLNHRDYHSWNLMIHEDAVAVIDFQDALLAPPQYDLASLLNDRITDSIVQPQMEKQLVSYYIDRRSEQENRTIDNDEFFEIYLLSAIQRDLKVVGRFYYLDVVKGKSGYKKFIPATVRRVKRNLARIPYAGQASSILAEHYEEMR